jgi:hypothetical protein
MVCGPCNHVAVDGVSILSDALKLRWDTPYRFVASVAALCALVGLFLHRSALETFSGLVSWLGWSSGAAGIRLTHAWLDQRSIVFVWLGIAFIIAGMIFAYRGGRGAATALVGAALCSESGSTAPFWIFGAAIVLWLVLRIVVWRAFNDEYWSFMRNFTFSFQALGAASVYAVAGPMRWAIFRFE